MTRVTSQKTRQVILGVDPALDLNITPERLAIFDQDGNPVNLGTATGDGIPAGGTDGQVMSKFSDDDYDAGWASLGGEVLLDAWKGEWVADTSYQAGDVVNYADGLWIALITNTDEPSEAGPPEVVNVICSGGGWPSGGADCEQIDGDTSLPWYGPAFEGDHFYFDVITAGTFTIWHAGTDDSVVYWYGPDLGMISNTRYTPAEATLGIGRHYLRVYAIGTEHGGDMSVVPITGEIVPIGGDAVSWDLMLQAAAGGEGGGEAPSLLEVWQGPWAAQNYAEGDTVRHDGALWVATDETTPDVEPGVATVDTVSFAASGWAGASTCRRLSPNVVTAWHTTSGSEAGFEHFFFDVTTAGPVTIDMASNALGYWELYQPPSATKVTGITAVGDYTHTCAVGRWYIRIQGNNNLDETSTIRLVPSGATVITPAAANPWEMMVQGV